jgi:hypothetical protein
VHGSRRIQAIPTVLGIVAECLIGIRYDEAPMRGLTHRAASAVGGESARR